MYVFNVLQDAVDVRYADNKQWGVCDIVNIAIFVKKVRFRGEQAWKPGLGYRHLIRSSRFPVKLFQDLTLKYIVGNSGF
jgi:hypothetical protein